MPGNLRAVAAFLTAMLSSMTACHGNEPLAVRVEPFTVAPAQTPMIYVWVKNQRDQAVAGRLSVELPGEWQVVPAKKEIQIAPGESQRVKFSSEQGANNASNRYPVHVTITNAEGTASRRQEVFCASAPYLRPEIDGRVEEWKDAIPVTFETAGKTTTVSTCWNRRAFSLLVAVEEEALWPQSASGPFDAVQFALAPEGAVTGTSPDDEAKRFEFLMVAGATGEGRVLQLAAPGMKLAQTAQSRSLEGLDVDGAELAVRHEADVTYYECSLPFGPMRAAIRPSEGRAFQFSLLVHDPDGASLRDLGQAAGLWPCQRNALAWSRFHGDSFGETPPYDSKTPWGFCSSKY